MLRDANGNIHQRRVAVEGRLWRVEDTVSGRFSRLALRWRLGAGEWHATPRGVEGPASITLSADAALTIALEPGWESPAYGVVRPCTVLTAHAAAPIRHIETRIGLP